MGGEADRVSDESGGAADVKCRIKTAKEMQGRMFHLEYPPYLRNSEEKLLEKTVDKFD